MKGDKKQVILHLAVEAGKDASGNKKTVWFKAHCFGRNQGFVEEHLKKGDQVVVMGKGDIYAYLKDGNAVATGDVFADVVEKFWPPKTGGTERPVIQQAAPQDDIPDF